MAKNNKQFLTVLILIGVIAVSVWTFSFEPTLSPGSLAYPPLPTDTPSGFGYPGPETATPTFTPFPYSEEEWFALPFYTQTPWPTPTPHSLPTADSFRQGVAGKSTVIPERHHFGSWGYAWDSSVPNPYPSNVEHIPMLVWRPWGAPDPGETPGPGTPVPPPTRTPEPTPIMNTIATRAALTPHDYWLIFNECEMQHQCRTAPQAAAISYHDLLVPFLNSVDPNAKLIVGGVNAHECGILWLEDFIFWYDFLYDEYPPYIAGWHFHLYPEIIPKDWMKEGLDGCDSNWEYDDDRVNTVDEAWDAWQTDVGNILGFVSVYGDIVEDEIWITEMGCLNPGFHEGQLPTPQAICGQEGYMYEYTRRITNWLNTTGRWVDRYAWYTDISGKDYQGYTRLYDREIWYTPTPPPQPGAPTPTPGYGFSALGNFYGGVTPAAAVSLTESMYFPVVRK